MTETSEQRQRREERTWYPDRKVSLAFIFTLLAQSAAIVWWASAIESRMHQTETTVSRIEVDQKIQQDNYHREQEDRAARFATLTVQGEAIRDSVQELKAGQRELIGLIRELARDEAPIPATR